MCNFVNQTLQIKLKVLNLHNILLMLFLYIKINNFLFILLNERKTE